MNQQVPEKIKVLMVQMVSAALYFAKAGIEVGIAS